MNKAVFDIGTNSIKLLIYSSPDKTIIAEYMKISQLGENLSKTGSSEKCFSVRFSIIFTSY